MLIKALSDYYDILAKAGKIPPEGYSTVNIHYLVSLTPEGKIDGIIDVQTLEETSVARGKTRRRMAPKKEVMPKRTKKPGIDVVIPEHNPLYLFGLNLTKGQFTTKDKTDQAIKSHEAFKEVHLKFLAGLDSPLINAFRNFIQSWDPEKETENRYLKALGKDYAKSGFAFCLSGSPDKLLHDEPQLKEKWDEEYVKKLKANADGRRSQCAVSGAEALISKVHDSKICGVYGGRPTGNVLVCFNNSSENSYGNKQSHNSNISVKAMVKYTEALNYLLSDDKHKFKIDDLTIVFWAMNPQETCENLFMEMFLGQSGQMNAEQTEDMLKALWKDAGDGRITEERLQSLDQIEPEVDFYMLGLKPNETRLSVKFIFRRKYADILWNIVRFQRDLQIGKELKPVSLWNIGEAMSPNNTRDKSKADIKVNAALFTKLFESVIYGNIYPSALLETMIRRVKIVKKADNEADKKRNKRIDLLRARVIKACINRNYPKEGLQVTADKENYNQAYLCGRLFAVLEKLQQDASGGNLNRTIKDAYFASASAKPALVFPKLINLAQNHLNKVKYPVFYNKLLQEIIGHLNGGLPDTLLLKEQGKFIVGYYQQYQDLYTRDNEKQNGETGIETEAK